MNMYFMSQATKTERIPFRLAEERATLLLRKTSHLRMLKKIILLIIIGAIGWYVYNDYMKSEVDQAFDATEEVVEEVVEDVEDAVDDM